MVVARASIVICALLTVGACQQERQVTSDLTVRRGRVEQTDGLSLLLEAADLPAAQRCSVHLEGLTFQPGKGRSTLSESISCKVLDRAHLVAALGESRLRTLAPVVFEGALEVRLTPAQAKSSHPLRGSLPQISLRVLGDSRQELTLARSAQAFRSAMGIREVEVTGRGVALTALTRDGAAARAGLRPRDIVERVNGGSIARASELVADPGAGLTQLSVLREDSAGPRRFGVDLAPRGQARSRPLTLLLIALGALSGLLLPALPRIGPRLGAVQRALALTGALLWLTACHVLSFRIHLVTLWIVPLAFHVAALVRAYAARSLSSVTLSREAVGLAMASLGAAALALTGHAAHDGVPPWSWPLAESPAAWLGAWVLALSGSPGRAGALDEAYEDAYVRLTARALGYASALVLVWFGMNAEHVPEPLGTSGKGGWLVVGIVLVCKVDLARWLLARLRTLATPGWTALACALLAPLLALVSTQLVPPGSRFALALGALTFGGLLGRFARTAVVRVTSRTGDHDPAFSPYL